MNKYDQYQIPCLYNIRRAREGGTGRALVVMAGGLGKTVVAAREVGDFLQSGRKRVLFLCHDLGILMQNRQKFEEILGDEYSFGFFYGEQKDLGYCDLLFATFQTMEGVSIGKEQFPRDEFAYIVVDEAHHSRAETFENVLDYFQPEFRLGLTATPEREDGKSLTEYFGEPVFELDFVEAWARGFLTPVEYVLVTREMVGAKEALDYQRRISTADFNRKIFVEMPDEEIVRDIQSRVSDIQNPRMIIFCRSIEHVERISKIYPGSRALHSEMSLEEQKFVLEEFRLGRISVIVVCDKLNEGIDVPAVDVIARLRLTGSKLLFEQQLSRGLRLHDGKEKVRVYDYASSLEQLEMLFNYEERIQKISEGLHRGPLPNASNETPKNQKFSITLSGGELMITRVDIAKLIEKSKSTGYSAEMLLEQLARVTVAAGRSLTEGEIQSHPECAAMGTLRSKLGRSYKRDMIPKLKEYLGLKAEEIDWSATDEIHEKRSVVPVELTTEEQQEFVKRLFMEWNQLYGCAPTKRAWEENQSLPTPQQCMYLFGVKKWNELLRLVGLVPRVDKEAITKTYDEAKMLQFLVDLQDEKGRPIIGRDIDEADGPYTQKSYEKKFGNLGSALKRAGLQVGYNSCWHKEEKANIDANQKAEYVRIGYEIWREFGGIPSNAILDKRSDFSIVTMRRLFGNKEAFVAEVERKMRMS